MTTDGGRKDFAQERKGAMSSDYGARAALAINQLVPGPHRDKAVARLFGCSVRTAQYLRVGLFWTINRLNQASAVIPEFDAYVADPLLARCDALEREIADIRGMLRGKEHG